MNPLDIIAWRISDQGWTDMLCRNKTTFQVSGREQDGLETERSFDALSGIIV